MRSTHQPVTKDDETMKKLANVLCLYPIYLSNLKIPYEDSAKPVHKERGCN